MLLFQAFLLGGMILHLQGTEPRQTGGKLRPRWRKQQEELFTPVQKQRMGGMCMCVCVCAVYGGVQPVDVQSKR